MNMRKKSVGLVAAAASSALVLAAGIAPAAQAADANTVTIWTSVDQPVLDGLKAGLAPIAKKQGITVKWEKVDNINQLIVTKVQANAAPDIALIPQPGVIADLVKRKAVKPLNDVVDMATLKKTMIPGELEAGTVNGKLYGLLTSMNVKGLVFYPKKAWNAAGYKIPTTMGQLEALTAQMVKAGQTPWCNGIESGTATGWPATDWIENLVMRYAGVKVYNDWVAGKVKFNSPQIKQAAAVYEKLFFNDANVNGGRKSIATNNFGTAGNVMFDAKPGCMMYSQGSFITGFFPKNIQAALDTEVGVFGLPPVKANGVKPIEGGGDLAALFSDSAAAKTIMKDLTNPAIGIPAAKNSSFLSPYKTFSLKNYPGALTKAIAGVAYNSNYFLFDGSDAMPGAVGAGSFWKEMTAWIAGQETLDQALNNIDASWVK